MALITQNDIENDGLQVCIGACSEPKARIGEPWFITVTDDFGEEEIYISLPRAWAQTVIDTLTRYLERTKESNE